MVLRVLLWWASEFEVSPEWMRNNTLQMKRSIQDLILLGKLKEPK